MDEVVVSRDGHVATVRLNEPERLNPLPADSKVLRETFQELGADPDVRAIVITGTGRGFCSGANVVGLAARAERARTNPDEAPASSSELLADTSFTPRRSGVYKPVITAVNGVCAGAGLHFLADADIVIAGESATFLDPHTTIGQVAALEPILFAKSGIPLNAILRMVVLGSAERLDARAALQVGLVSEVVPDDELAARAQQLGEQASAASPAAVEASLRAIWGSLELPLAEAYVRGHQAIGAFRSHPDASEGPQAFREKRTPEWQVGPVDA